MGSNPGSTTKGLGEHIICKMWGSQPLGYQHRVRQCVQRLEQHLAREQLREHLFPHCQIL